MADGPGLVQYRIATLTPMDPSALKKIMFVPIGPLQLKPKLTKLLALSHIYIYIYNIFIYIYIYIYIIYTNGINSGNHKHNTNIRATTHYE